MAAHAGGPHASGPQRRVPPRRFPIAAHGRVPSRAEVAQIATAVSRSVLVGQIAGGVALPVVRVSRLNPEWAFATLRPRGPDGPGPALGVFQRGPSGWALRQVGTSGVGRDIVPAAVLVEFGLLGDYR